MMTEKRLNDVFDTWLTGGGIFASLQNLSVPWQDKNISASLDLVYHGDISGEKFCSPLINKMISGDTLTGAEKTILATAIMAVNGDRWNKLWATMSYEYNPIENYSMTEIMTDDETVIDYGKTTTRTDNLTHRRTGTDTQTPDVTETQTPNLTTNTDSGVYGFNSVTDVSADTQTQTATGTNTNRRTGTDTTTYNTTDADTGTQAAAETGQDTHTRNYTLTRSGNIGVTTSQQMIESERNLWMWKFFYDVVFPDIDRVLTIQIY